MHQLQDPAEMLESKDLFQKISSSPLYIKSSCVMLIWGGTCCKASNQSVTL